MSNCSKNDSDSIKSLEQEMAHVVGVPRRDPCQKCQLPVFLAERLTVGKKVFHRTCLKCARCGSQLTIGSFYETEIDDVFCCETCPDEEEFEDKLNNQASGSSTINLNPNDNEDNSIPSKPVRSSLADRLAFFEKPQSVDINSPTGKKLLGTSLSDEEKTKELQQTSSLSSPTSKYKTNVALSNFLNKTIDCGEKDETEDNSELSSSVVIVDDKDTKSMDTSDSDNIDEIETIEHIIDYRYSKTPKLPETQPPLDDLKESQKINDEQQRKRFTATAELQLTTTKIGDAEIDGVQLKEKPESSSNSSRIFPSNEKSHNLHPDPEMTNSLHATEAHKSHTNETEDYLDLSGSNVNENVTKDKSPDAPKTPDVCTDEIVELRRKSSGKTSESPDVEDKATTERLSVVRARLQQFEEITYNQNNNNNISNIKSLSPEKGKPIQSPTNDVTKSNVDKNIDVGNNIDINIDEPSNALENLNRTAIENVENEVPKNILHECENDENVTAITAPQPSPRRVPLNKKTKDETLENNEDVKVRGSPKDIKQSIESIGSAKPILLSSPVKTPSKVKPDDYPEDLNPFKSDDDDDDDLINKENLSSRQSISKKSEKSENSNPFDSSDDEIELEKSSHSAATGPTVKTNSAGKVRPPRPPPPRISRNPFDEDENDEQNFSRLSSLTSSATKKTPVPTPRSNVSQSQNPTPEPTPRLSNKTSPKSIRLHNSNDCYGSIISLGTTPGTPLYRNSDIRGSNNSLTLSSGGTIRSRKNRKAPPPPQHPPTVKELFPSTETIESSKASTPSSSTLGSPKMSRKKRPAPPPPKPIRLETISNNDQQLNGGDSKNSIAYPLQSDPESKSLDTGKTLLEGKAEPISAELSNTNTNLKKDGKFAAIIRRNSRRLIPLDMKLIKDAADHAHEAQCDDQKQQLIDQDEHNVVYRRVIMPSLLNTPTHDRANKTFEETLRSEDRQSEKLKDNKEAKNRNRQSQQSASSGAEDVENTIFNKSVHGKWKRRKGPAPALPIPPRRVLQMLPLQEIRHELDIIEVQQQGLEKQGVVLEKMIRDRCEGKSGELLNTSIATNSLIGAGDNGASNNFEGVQNTKEVEDLILQLFELVNEKNELFRRQAELMYLRRQHRLEQEQADLEYEIRVLMAQPERNKTDSDKAREEALIARLVNVVQLRNEVIECLEMDRLREAEEDMSIKQRLEQHTAKRNGLNIDETSKRNGSKLSKKEKKKQKEAKKLSKNKKIDADKDADESELTADKQKLRKKKRKFLF